jgi:hypothetical protein
MTMLDVRCNLLTDAQKISYRQIYQFTVKMFA